MSWIFTCPSTVQLNVPPHRGFFLIYIISDKFHFVNIKFKKEALCLSESRLLFAIDFSVVRQPLRPTSTASISCTLRLLVSSIPAAFTLIAASVGFLLCQPTMPNIFGIYIIYNIFHFVNGLPTIFSEIY